MQMLQKLLLVFLLLCLAVPRVASGQGIVGTARILEGDRGTVIAGGQQQRPAIASAPDRHLVAWADERSAFDTVSLDEGSRDVFAQLIGMDGQPLTPQPFRIHGGSGRKEHVDIAWNGSCWLVTWQNDVPSGFFYAAALFGMRVSLDGTLLDPEPIMIHGFSSSSYFRYALDSDGVGWCVVMQGSGFGETDIRGAVLGADGQVALVQPSIFGSAWQLRDFDLAWDGNQHLLVFNKLDAIRGRRLDSTLQTVGSGLALAGQGQDPSVTSAGNGFLVAWSDYSGGSTSLVRYRTVGAAGSMGSVVTVSQAPTWDMEARVTWNGSGYDLVWMRNYIVEPTLRHARIDSVGLLLDHDGQPLGSGDYTSEAKISSSGNGDSQVVYCATLATPPHPGDILGIHIQGGVSGSPVDVGTSAPRQSFADLVAGPAGYLAVYSTERGGAISILAQRLTEDGLSIDSEPIELASGLAYGLPAVAWGGQNYLVVWQDERVTNTPLDDQVLGMRLAPDGSPIDPVPFLVLDGGLPDVAFVGGDYMVVARTAISVAFHHIHGMRVGMGGELVDSVPILISTTYASRPQVETLGSSWLCAWQQKQSHDNGGWDVLSRVIHPAGSMSPVQIIGDGLEPSIAVSPWGAIVVWTDLSIDLRAQMLDTSGVEAGGELTVAEAGGTQGLASVAWTGTQYLVTWHDRRNNQQHFIDDYGDIYGTRITAAGLVLDPGGLGIATTVEEEHHPVTAGREGRALVAFSGFQPDVPLGSMRIGVVTVVEECSGSNYCVAVANSTGNAASMGWQGSLSVSANSLLLECSDLVPHQSGVFYYGLDDVLAPFGNGFRCVGGSVYRFPPQAVDATGRVQYLVDFTAPPQLSGRISGGSTWNFQFWYRDPLAGGAAFNLSDGLSLTFCD